MSTTPTPLFDMSKAQAIGQPSQLFDMSKATPIATPTSWRQPKDPFSGQPFGSMMPPEMASAVEKSNRLQGRAGQVQNLVQTPVSNAVGAVDIAGAVPELAKLTPAMKASRAGGALNALEKEIGSHPVQMTDKLAGALADIKQGADTGLQMPSVVNKLVTRLSNVEEGPLTYQEARQFYSNMGDLAASDRMAMNAKGQRLLFQVQHALGDTIADTTERAGNLPVYQGAMKDFASAKSAEEKIEVLKDFALKFGKAAGWIGGGGYGLYQAAKELQGK